MGVSEEEAKVSAELKAEIEKVKLSCFSFLGRLSGATKGMLDAAGYGGKSNAEAMKIAYDAARVRINNMITAFERKYQDDRS